MGYDAGSNDLAWIQRELARIKEWLAELSQPSSGQIYQQLAEIQSLVNDLAARVNALAASGVEWKGPVNTSGNVTAGGRVTSAAPLRSPGSRSYVVSTGYAGLWAETDGTIGIAPSSIRFKTDIEEWMPDISRMILLRAVLFRYDPAVFEGMDPDAPKQLGFIAEELEALGFPEFLFYDSDGLVEGINYDRMTIALLRLAQWQEARLQAVEARLDAAGL